MINRLPPYFKQEFPDSETKKLTSLLAEFKVHTVCQEAKCPNINHCFKNRHLTFMILGKVCTRNCRFCNVTKAGTVLSTKQNSSPKNGDSSASAREPSLISELVKLLGLNFVVITSVTRDDLADGGASVFARTIELIRKDNPEVKIEVLIPDFQGKIKSLKCLIEARPDVIAHNIETVRRLYNDLRPMADYQRSLQILSKLKQLAPNILIKSSIMLGFGETESEIIQTMVDLKSCNCDYFTLGQYLAPSPKHYPVKEFIDVGKFKKYKQIGLKLGFKAVLSGPKVRSSYKPKELYNEYIHS